MLKNAFVIVLSSLSLTCFACTAIVMHYQKQTISGRTFDWPDGHGFFITSKKGDEKTSLALPKGQSPLHWRAQYNSVDVVMSLQNQPNKAAVVDGMNSQGLNASVLELDQTRYPSIKKTTPALGSTQWVAYVLDNFANVKQAVNGMRHVAVIASIYKGLHVPLHYIVVDAKGDRAIFEYTNGKLNIYQSISMPVPVLTNTPYNAALESIQDQKTQGYGSMARFNRAVNYLAKAPKPKSIWQSLSLAFDILADSAEPLGSAYPTKWTLVRNNSQKQMYWRTAWNQHIHHINLNQLNYAKDSIISRINSTAY